MNFDPDPISVELIGDGPEGSRRGRGGDFHNAWVMFVQSNGIILAVWIMTWAVES